MDNQKPAVPDSQFKYWARPIYINRANRIYWLSHFNSLFFLVLTSIIFWLFTGAPFLGAGTWLQKLILFPIATILVTWSSRPLLNSSLLLTQVCELDTPPTISKMNAVYSAISDLPKRLLSGFVAGLTAFFLFNPSVIWLKTSWAQDEGYPRLSSGLFDIGSFLALLAIAYSFRRILNNHDYVSFKNQAASNEGQLVLFSFKKGCRSLYISVFSVFLSIISSRFAATAVFSLFVKTWHIFQDTLLAPPLFQLSIWPRFPIQIFVVGLLIDVFWGSLGGLVSLVFTEPLPISDVLNVSPETIVSGLSLSQAHDDFIRMLCVHVLKDSVNDFGFRSKIYGSSTSDSISISKGTWPNVHETLLTSIKEFKQSLDDIISSISKLETKYDIQTGIQLSQFRIYDITSRKKMLSFLHLFASEKFPAAFALLTPDHPQVQLQSKTNIHQVGLNCALVLCHLLKHAQIEDEVGAVQFEVKSIINTLISLYTSVLNLLARINSLSYKIPSQWGYEDLQNTSVALKEQIDLISRIYSDGLPNSLSI